MFYFLLRCKGKCHPGRGDFLRAAAAAAFASVACAGATLPAAAQVGTMSPSRADGNRLVYALPRVDGVLIDETNDVAITRVQRSVSAFTLGCPHLSRTTLSWDDTAGVFYCPKHEPEFRQNGELVRGRPARGMDRYAVRRDPAGVAVDTRTIYQQDLDPQWATSVVRV